MSKKKVDPLARALRRYRRGLAQQGIVSKQASLEIFSRKKLGKPSPDYCRDSGFYETREWREVRYEALRNSGGACACCGATRSGGAVLHVDHIKPRYTHPELSLYPSNLQVLCADCNLGKGAWDSTDFRPVRRLVKK